MNLTKRILCGATLGWFGVSDIILRLQGHHGGIGGLARAIAVLVFIYIFSRLRRREDGDLELR